LLLSEANSAAKPAVFTHHPGEVSLDNAFSLIEGHPANPGGSASGGSRFFLRAVRLEENRDGKPGTDETFPSFFLL
jgi:hypothetical protein